MATVWGSGTQADPWTRWEGSAYEFFYSVAYGQTYYTRVGAYFNITDAGDPHVWDDYWVNDLEPNGTYGLSKVNYGMSGTCSATGTIEVWLCHLNEDDDIDEDRIIYLTILPPPSYTVSVYSAGGGTVSGGGTYTQGSTATISATPNTGYHFTNWSDGNTSASRSFTVTGNVSLTAYFAINTYTVSLTAGSGGTVSGGGTYNYGSTANISATPNAHYHFTNWSDGSTSASRSFTVTGNVTLTAYFAIDTHTISTAVSPSGTGSVTGGGSYTYGSSATLTAVPSTNYEFEKWQDDSTTNPRSVTVTGNTSFTAYFKMSRPPINYKVNGAWTQVTPYIKINGEWVKIKKIYYKNNGTWSETK